MKTPDLDITTKIQSIIALGDLCMQCATELNPFLPRSIQLLQQAMTSSLQKYDRISDVYMYDNMLSLRNAIIDCLVSLTFGVKES